MGEGVAAERPLHNEVLSVKVQAGPRERPLLTHVHAGIDSGPGVGGGASQVGFSPEAMAPEPQGVAGPSRGSWRCGLAPLTCGPCCVSSSTGLWSEQVGRRWDGGVGILKVCELMLLTSRRTWPRGQQEDGTTTKAAKLCPCVLYLDASCPG